MNKFILETAEEISPEEPSSWLLRNIHRYVKIVREILKLPEGPILDLGTGRAYLAVALKKMGREVFAVDYFYGDWPKDVCQRYHIPYHQVNVETTALPYEDESFSGVIFAEVLEHLTYSPLIPLREIQRVLRDGGRLILTTPNVAYMVNRLRLWLGMNIYSDLADYYINLQPIYQEGKAFFYRHNRLYTMGELNELMREAGFHVVTNCYLRGGAYTGSWAGILNPLLVISGALLPSTRDTLMVVGERKEGINVV